MYQHKNGLLVNYFPKPIRLLCLKCFLWFIFVFGEQIHLCASTAVTHTHTHGATVFSAGRFVPGSPVRLVQQSSCHSVSTRHAHDRLRGPTADVIRKKKWIRSVCCGSKEALNTCLYPTCSLFSCAICRAEVHAQCVTGEIRNYPGLFIYSEPEVKAARASGPHAL